MALFRCSFFSKILSTMADVMVYLPSPGSTATLQTDLQALYAPKPPHKVLYLLHGMYEDETTWMRKSNIERYAQQRGLAVVCPRAENGFYIDMRHGPQWFTYLTEELPRFIGASFPVSGRREDTFIAGLSMGGYGACLAALRLPERYGAAASLSGAVDLPQVVELADRFGLGQMAADIVDPATVAGSQQDLFALADRLVAEGRELPPLYLACGTEDEVCLPMNRRFVAALQALGWPLRWQEGPGGHEWDFWDAQIQQVLAWLPL